MNLLRRILYWQAVIWAIAGLALAALPKLVLESSFGQVHYPEYAWIRIMGLHAVGLSLFMVLVAQRLEDLWWFSWVFVLTTAATATVAALNAVFGLPDRSSSVLWWGLSAVAAGFTAALLWAVARTGQERPFA